MDCKHKEFIYLDEVFDEGIVYCECLDCGKQFKLNIICRQISMFEWIKNLLDKTVFRTEPVIRCKVCYLKAKYEFTATTKPLDSEESDEFKINICQGCLDELKIKIRVMKNENERNSNESQNVENRLSQSEYQSSKTA